jgi:stage II sporulation protein D
LTRTFNFRVLVAVFLLATAVVPHAFADVVPSSFTFHGSGYGHGVGMSQIGARGQALEGDSATAILNYYYKDVVVNPVQDDQILRVNVGHLLTSVSFKTETKLGHLELFNADMGDTVTSVADTSVPTKSTLSFILLGNSAIPSVTDSTGKISALASGSSFTLRWSGTRELSGVDSVLSMKIGSTTTKYRYGQLQIKLVKSALLGYRIEVTNSLRLHDEYLWGIGEMPSSWPAQALQAQAIASRTYALSKTGKIKAACDCDLYASTADQNFVGYSKETEPKYGVLWKNAVDSTSMDASHGLAILYNLSPISAYFFSSSGGQTESAKDAWGSAVPYATSVPDPWSLMASLNSKYVDWIRPIGQSVIANAFGLPEVASLLIVSRHQSGTVAIITATSSSGKSVSLTGETFRSKSKLPSAWFDFETAQISNVVPVPVRTIFHSL